MIKFCFSLVFSGPKFPNFLSPFPPFPSKQGTSGWKSQGLIPAQLDCQGRGKGSDRGWWWVQTQHNATASAAARQYFSPSLVGLILQLPQPTPTDTYKGHNDGQKQRAIGVLFIANIAILLCHQCDGKLSPLTTIVITKKSEERKQCQKWGVLDYFHNHLQPLPPYTTLLRSRN